MASPVIAFPSTLVASVRTHCHLHAPQVHVLKELSVLRTYKKTLSPVRLANKVCGFSFNHCHCWHASISPLQPVHWSQWTLLTSVARLSDPTVPISPCYKMVRWVGMEINCHDVILQFQLLYFHLLGTLLTTPKSAPDVNRLALSVLLELSLFDLLRSRYSYIIIAIIQVLKDTLWSSYDVHNNYARVQWKEICRTTCYADIPL